MAKLAFLGQINDPPRSPLPGAAIIIFLVTAFTVDLVLPGATTGKGMLYLTMLALPLAIASRRLPAIHLNVFLLFFFLVGILPHFHTYPFNRLSALLPYAYTVAVIPALRKSVGWLRVGTLGAKLWLFLLAIILVAGLALWLWVRLLNPDLSHYTGMLPQASTGVVLAFGIGFSAFNALLEEITWRGVMLEALDSALGAGWLALILQAISFGLAHYQTGFPNGVVGAAMACAYGLMLGVVRRKSRGMLACWLAHVLADSVIFCLIFAFAHQAAR